MNRYALLRFERGLTRDQVSEASGVHRNAIARLENGETKLPQADTAKALADAYKITVAELLGVEDREAA